MSDADEAIADRRGVFLEGPRYLMCLGAFAAGTAMNVVASSHAPPCAAGENWLTIGAYGRGLALLALLAAVAILFLERSGRVWSEGVTVRWIFPALVGVVTVASVALSVYYLAASDPACSPF